MNNVISFIYQNSYIFTNVVMMVRAIKTLDKINYRNVSYLQLLVLEYRLPQLVWIRLSNLGKFNLDFAKTKDEHVAVESFLSTLC